VKIKKTDAQRVREALDYAAADGTVETGSEALKGIAKNSVTASERKALQAAFEDHFDELKPGARRLIEQFLNGASAGSPNAPEFFNDSKGKVEYRPAELSRADVSTAKKADQGGLGDCYFISALEAVLHGRETRERKPLTEILGEMTRMTDADRCEVRFFSKRANGRMKEVWVPISTDLPFDKEIGKLAYGGNTTQLWVALLEKAYAQFRGGYQAIGDGGYCDEVMQALTGKRADNTQITPDNAEEQYERVKAALAKGKVATCGTNGVDQTDYSTGEAGPESEFEKAGLVPGHAYSIHNVFERDGERFLTLRNPWGSFVPKGKSHPGRDGVFELSLKDFGKYFGDLQIGG